MKKVELKKFQYQGVENKDYEILTIGAIMTDMTFIPFDRAFKTNLFELSIGQRNGIPLIDYVLETINDHRYIQILTSPPLSRKHDVYLLDHDMVDLDTAYDCGFGIIRVLKGVHKGKYFLYNPHHEKEDFLFMLDVYLQVAVKGYINKSLKNFIDIKKGQMTLRVLQFTDDIDLNQKVEISFNK